MAQPARRFGIFVERFTQLFERGSKRRFPQDGAKLLAELVGHDDWLPAHLCHPVGTDYSQYLLHLDKAERFSTVAFVWQPGRGTPIHDHTVWGLVGMLRGAELDQRFALDAGGVPVALGEPSRLHPGDVAMLSPADGDIHQVSNALDDQVSISIHVYGGNIGTIARSSFSADGARNAFVSGYSQPRGEDQKC